MARASSGWILVLSFASLWLLYWLYTLGYDTTTSLSPQGCRMAYMSPSYILHTLPPAFLALLPSSLRHRYSLSLYREVGWQSSSLSQQPGGVPVFFIPGNAGSSHQVRSIASSATRQFYTSPGVESPTFSSSSSSSSSSSAAAPLDFWAMEHNGDLSALHAPTLQAEQIYARVAASYVLSLYPSDTPLLLVAHSMGGLVASALLDDPELGPRVAALVTLSTPHTLPPARFDRRLERLYDAHLATLSNSSITTPVLSLCGGAADGMIPSESCLLPPSPKEGTFRHTVFGSALDGAWTSLAHQVSVWCDQPRWTIARALLLLAPLGVGEGEGREAVAAVLTHYFVSARDRMAPRSLELSKKEPKYLAPGAVLDLRAPDANGVWMLPVPIPSELSSPVFAYSTSSSHYLTEKPDNANATATLVLFLFSGSMRAIGPRERDSKLTAWPHVCAQADLGAHTCTFLEPPRGGVRLIPDVGVSWRSFSSPSSPSSRSSSSSKVEDATFVFPPPGEGVSEDNGIALYESPVSLDAHTTRPRWAAVEVEGADGRGAILGGFATSGGDVVVEGSVNAFIFRPRRIHVDPASLRTHIHFPSLVEDARVVYRVTPVFAPAPHSTPAASLHTPDSLRAGGPPASCRDARIPPLLMHHSTATNETAFHPLAIRGQPALLHSHASGPFLPPAAPHHGGGGGGMNVTLYTSADPRCAVRALDVRVDVRASLGRCAARYWTAVPAWGAAVAAVVFADAWRANEAGAPIPSVTRTLTHYTRRTLPLILLPLSLAASLVPLPHSSAYLLGGAHAAIAPLLLLVASGAVCVSWGVLCAVMWVLAWIPRRSDREDASARTTLISLGAILLLVALLVPWQVAFLGCWLVLLYTCAAPVPPTTTTFSENGNGYHVPADDDTVDFDSASTIADDDSSLEKPPSASSPPPPYPPHAPHSDHHLATHLLLLTTWLLPLVAPVLAVYTRTALNGGFAPTAFVGDHSAVHVLPWIVLVDWTTRVRGRMFDASTLRHPLAPHLPLLAATLCVAVGARRAYDVYTAHTVLAAFAVVFRVGRRYWGGAPWGVV